MFHLYVFFLISSSRLFFFFFNDPATTEIYTLSLHDALPISSGLTRRPFRHRFNSTFRSGGDAPPHNPHGSSPHTPVNRQSTRTGHPSQIDRATSVCHR